MNGYSGTIQPPGLYVRALYDYDADDQTSLSFQQGDVIQVLTQLESGWWDGIMHGQRGWFPSNYCEWVTGPEAARLDQEVNTREEEDTSIDPSSDDDRDDEDENTSLARAMSDTRIAAQHSSQVNGDGARHRDQEAEAFWIPQATPDGRLFYFNTLTGVSATELPLESADGAGADGGPSGSGAQRPSRSRPQPNGTGKLPAHVVPTDNDEADATDVKAPRAAAKRGSFMSDGTSPATSLESLNMPSSSVHPTARTSSKVKPQPSDSMTSSFTSIDSSKSGPSSKQPAHNQASGLRTYLDDNSTVSLTWDRLVQDMRKAVERYCQTIERRDRAEYVRRAEDISDILRLLLAAGSGTTDNHSGFPSIIATNRALYPHFRDMMSRFSKLVLSSHIAAADFAAPDTHTKCLQEASGMMNGVFGFVDVAQQQRGQDIPRLFPGFVKDKMNGGNWQNNGLSRKDSMNSTSFIDQEEEYDQNNEPTQQLDASILERMNDLKRLIVSCLRRLEGALVIQDKIISHQKHKRMSTEICTHCGKLIEQYKPWMSCMESINLTSTGKASSSPQVSEFSILKQRIYTFVAELIITCQNVGAPLADEWESNRGETLEQRIDRVRAVSRNLESTTSKVNQCLQQFADMDPMLPNGNLKAAPEQSKAPSPIANRVPPGSGSAGTKSPLGDISSAVATTGPSDAAGLFQNAGNRKINKIFGEAPMVRETSVPTTNLEEMPEYLGLDHEGDVQYDNKTEPPSIRGGTLVGLVEQLTRHDRYDAPFKTTFLLTYQSFTTAPELFESLLRRWNLTPPEDLAADEIEVWASKKRSPIRMRIVNVMKSWIDTYWMEGNDAVSQDLITRIYNFAKDTVASSGTPGWRPLLNVIEQRMRGEDTQAKKLVPNPNYQTPLPILPKNMKKLKFLDIDATEFARQLTIIESRLYSKIKPHECLNKIWQKKPQTSDHEMAANVKALILHSNRLTNWVAEMILSQNEPKKRVSVIKHFVSVADKCQGLNNFSTLTSIISALGTAPIHRLNRTWALVGKTTATTLEKMRRLMGSTKNFNAYRETLHQSNPPCIPFFGVYLTDLTFIEDGIPSMIKKTDLINFQKRAKTAEIIREIQTYQNVSYPYKAVPELQDYILSMMQSAGDVHEMYDRSLAVEPREREDEKIARLLIENFFGD